MMPHVSRSAGFSLLELMIASALTTTILMLVWSLFGIYSKLDTRGAELATELQLSRALMMQFRRDLHHLVTRNQEGPTTDTPDGEALPQGGQLQGTQNELAFVIQTGKQTVPPVSEVTDVSAETTDVTLQASEIYSLVRYLWNDPMDPDALESQQPSGDRSSDRRLSGSEATPYLPTMRRSELLRTEAGWQATYVPAGESSVSQRLNPDPPATSDSYTKTTGPVGSGADRIGIDGRGTSSAVITGAVTGASAQETRDLVPEVSALRFRYFDGVVWRSSWSSGLDGRLPAAIELSFDLDCGEEEAMDSPNELLAIPDETREAESVADVLGEDGGLTPRYEYRVVVRIPAATSATPSETFVP